MHVFLVTSSGLPMFFDVMDERRTTVFVVMRMRESSLISKIWRTIMKSEH